MRTYTELPVTVADLEGLPDDGNRYEVIEGELHVSSAPAYLHQFSLSRLLYEIQKYLEVNPIGEMLPGLGVIFDQFNGVIPDLVYCSNERLAQILASGRLIAAPEIVVEILSPGAANERRDKVLKRQIYSGRGAHEYWLIDPELRTIEVSRKRKDGGLKIRATLQESDELTSVELPGFSLAVSKIFK
jgi:Uma2 family endonuclease